jgi:hypothetical protein
MAYEIFYTMLFTDQGMGNLISIVDETKPTIVLYSALIDFGSAHSSLTDETVNFVKTYVDTNRAAGKKPDFDLVVVSHQDNDHWSLFPKLIAKFSNNSKMTIGKLKYGGDIASYGTGAAQAVAQLAQLAVDSKPLPVTECSYYSTTGPTAALDFFPAQSPYVRLVPVISNVATASTKKDIKNNTVSLMVGVQWAFGGKVQTSVLLPGDLTSSTLIGLFKVQPAAFADLTGIRVLSIPHHGSHRTISDNYDTDINDRTFNLATWFAKWMAAGVLGASAGFASHRHPYQSVIDLFAANVLSSTTEHPYVSYDQKAGRYSKRQEKRMIFTNYSDVPQGVITSMSQITGSDRITSIQGISHRIMFKITQTQVVTTILAPNSAPGPGLAARRRPATQSGLAR